MADFNDKSKNAYNQIADDYDSTPEGRFTLEFKRLLVSNIDLRENASILDVACGNGSLLSMLNKVKPIKGFGIDIADQMIKNAAVNNPDMVFKVSGCEAIPFQNDTMDIITVCAAYHHFPDVASFAGEAMRVLKKKGKIYIADMYFPSALRLLLNPFVPLSKSGDVRFYAPKQIANNFKRIGFEAVDSRISGRIQLISMQKS